MCACVRSRESCKSTCVDGQNGPSREESKRIRRWQEVTRRLWFLLFMCEVLKCFFVQVWQKKCPQINVKVDSHQRIRNQNSFIVVMVGHKADDKYTSKVQHPCYWCNGCLMPVSTPTLPCKWLLIAEHRPGLLPVDTYKGWCSTGPRPGCLCTVYAILPPLSPSIHFFVLSLFLWGIEKMVILGERWPDHKGSGVCRPSDSSALAVS